jgi:hypothetical protein
MNRQLALVVVVCALALMGCPPVIDTGDGGDGPVVVGPEGGLFIRNGWAINVPRGALTAQTVIQVTIVDTGVPEVPGRKRISLGYRFSPTSLTFATPATLYLPWVHDRVPVAVDPSSFDMRRQGGSEAFAQLPGTKTDTIPFEAIEAQTDRLGLFWDTSPADPNIDRIEIAPATANLHVGDTQQFTGTIVTPTGMTIDVPITWSVVPPRVGTVSSTGLFTAVAPGVATITATVGTKTSTATANVFGTSKGPATFEHQNPFPTGNDLHGGLYGPAGLGTLYAGDNGTVLAKDATGQWSRLASTPGVTLNAVAGTTPTNAVAIGNSGTSGVLVEFNGSAAPKFTVFQPTDITTLGALWFDGTSGMGVGSGNQLVIRRNGAWTKEYHPSFETLLSVIGDGLGSFVVVGDLGSIYKWDPARAVWDSLYDLRLAVKLDAAQLVDFSTGETWAVGGNQLWHFVNGGWTSESLPASPVLAKGTAIGVVDGRVVVGGAVTLNPMFPPATLGQILVRTAATPTDGGVALVDWVNVPMRSAQVPRGVFASGAQGTVVGDFGAVWSWDQAAQTFTEESRGFYGDVVDLAVISSDVFAAVNECGTLACATRAGHVMHASGAGGLWTELAPLPTLDTITAIAAASASEVIVATSTAGLWRFDGSGWSTLPVSGAVGAVLDLQYCGTDLWGVGEMGAVYRGSAEGLTKLGSVGTGNVTSLQCPTSSEVWVAGDGFMAQRLATGVWSPKTSDQVNQASWNAVWAPGGGEGFAFGAASYGIYFDTATLTAVQAFGGILPDTVSQMWGASIDTLYLVGLTHTPLTFGFALRFDGVNWSLVDSGSQRKVTAISGSSTANMWLGTVGGGVLKAGAVQ